MQQEFVPYSEALQLKELGFDEPCFGYYNKEGELNPYSPKSIQGELSGGCTAPLYQQAFRYFREKHNKHVSNDFNPDSYWFYSIYDLLGRSLMIDNENFQSFEEAQLDCLQQLIKICKSEK